MSGMEHSPPPDNTCYARSHALASFNAWMDTRTQALCIVGPAGCGKTHLARWAATQRAKHIVFCTFTGCTTREDILHRLLLALELGHITRPEERLQQAIKHAKETLFILDDVTQCAAVMMALVKDWHVDVQRQLVMTSRATVLHVQTLQLGPWSPEDALIFFNDQCDMRGIVIRKEEKPDVVALLHQLDHLPLAIVLAIPMMQLMSPNALFKALPARFAAIHPPLHQAIGTSIELLSPMSRHVLACCAVSEGGFDLEFAEATITSQDETWVGTSLNELLHHHLAFVRHVDDHRCFFLYECVRAEVLLTIDSEMVSRHRETISVWVQEQLQALEAHHHTPTDQHIYQWCRRYGAHVDHTITHYEETEQWTLALSLLLRWTSFGRDGVVDHTLMRMERLRRQVPSPDEQLECLFILTMARLENDRGQLARARQLSQEALKRGECFPVLWLKSALIHARSLRDMGDVEAAVDILQQGLERAMAQGQVVYELPIRADLARLFINMARFGKDPDAMNRAEIVLDAALFKHQQVSIQRAALCLDARALLLHEQGRTRQGQIILNDLIERLESAPQRADDLLLVLYAHAGMFAFVTCQFKRAMSHAVKSAKTCERIGHQERYARALCEQGTYAVAGGFLVEAERLLLQAEELCQRHGQKMMQLTAITQLVMLYVETKQLAQARFWFERGDIQARALSAHGHLGLLLLWGSIWLESSAQSKQMAAATEALSMAWEYQHPVDAPRWKTLSDVMAQIHQLRCVPRLLQQGEATRVRVISVEARHMLEVAQTHGEDAFTLVAYRHLRTLLEETVTQYSVPQMTTDAAVLLVDAQGAWFKLNGEHIDLTRKETLRRLFQALLERWRPAPASPEMIPLTDMVGHGWPNEILEPQSAANRVYASVRLLRRLGLRDILLHQEGGYYLDPNIYLHRLTDNATDQGMAP